MQETLYIKFYLILNNIHYKFIPVDKITHFIHSMYIKVTELVISFNMVYLITEKHSKAILLHYILLTCISLLFPTTTDCENKDNRKKYADYSLYKAMQDFGIS